MTLEQCSLCGMCRTSCPIYRLSFKETTSPRGFAVLGKRGISDEVIYQCTLCGACKEACPAKVDLELEKARENLIKRRIETEAGKRMLANIREFGNPFGKLEKGSKPKELFCC